VSLLSITENTEKAQRATEEFNSCISLWPSAVFSLCSLKKEIGIPLSRLREKVGVRVGATTLTPALSREREREPGLPFSTNAVPTRASNAL
jgi:hypothetical protein